MDLNDLLKPFQKEKKDIFLYVKEDEHGIITYINPMLKQLNSAYKEQLKSFLTGVLKELEGKKNA